MSVYFIQAEDGGPIKIGTAIDPWGRMRTLQTGNATRLVMIAVIDGDRYCESSLHAKFSELRITGSEWFRAEPRLCGFIEGLKFKKPSDASVDVDYQRLHFEETFGLSCENVKAMAGYMAGQSLLNRYLAFDLTSTDDNVRFRLYEDLHHASQQFFLMCGTPHWTGFQAAWCESKDDCLDACEKLYPATTGDEQEVSHNA